MYDVYFLGITKIHECPIDVYIPIWLLGKLPLFTTFYILHSYKQSAAEVKTQSIKFMIIYGMTVQIDIIWQLAGNLCLTMF